MKHVSDCFKFRFLTSESCTPLKTNQPLLRRLQPLKNRSTCNSPTTVAAAQLTYKALMMTNGGQWLYTTEGSNKLLMITWHRLTCCTPVSHRTWLSAAAVTDHREVSSVDDVSFNDARKWNYDKLVSTDRLIYNRKNISSREGHGSHCTAHWSAAECSILNPVQLSVVQILCVRSTPHDYYYSTPPEHTRVSGGGNIIQTIMLIPFWKLIGQN